MRHVIRTTFLVGTYYLTLGWGSVQYQCAGMIHICMPSPGVKLQHPMCGLSKSGLHFGTLDAGYRFSGLVVSPVVLLRTRQEMSHCLGRV